MSFPLDYGVSLGWPAGHGFHQIAPGDYDAATIALLARMTVQPSASDAQKIDRHIRQLKAASLWTKFTIYKWRGVADAQSAKLNWASSSFDSVASGATQLGFTPYRGFDCDGTNYFTSGYNPSSSGGWSQNSHGFGAVVQKAPVSTGFNMWGNQSNRLNVSSAYLVSSRSGNSASDSAATVASNLGSFGVDRSASGTYKFRYNGAATATVTRTSQSVLNQAVQEGAQNTSSVAPAGVRFLAYWVCTPLADADAAVLYALQSEFAAALGIPFGEVG